MILAHQSPAKHWERTSIATKLAALTLLLVLAALASFGVHSELQFREFTKALDAEVATYKRQRWERPALRGPGSEGNAAAEILGLLRGFSGLSPEQREGLAGQLYYGQPFAAGQNALLDRYAALVSKLRAATWLSWSMTELSLEKAGEPPYKLAMDAALLMLAQAARGNPDECLSGCADVVRFGQDLVPGAPLEAASVSMRISSMVSRVMPHCALKASTEGVLRAARELHTLAEHAPAAASGIELADLSAGMKLRGLAQLFAAGDDSSLVTRVRRRPALFQAWHYFENAARWRELTPDRYPQVLETWQREQEWRGRSELKLVADATAPVVDWLYDDMRGQALVRELAVAMATKAERMRRQRTPREPVQLLDPALLDPFTGRALKWRLSPDATELSLWSVGEDRRDDKGSSEWTSQAPVDIVVHLRLKTARELDGARATADTAD